MRRYQKALPSRYPKPRPPNHESRVFNDLGVRGLQALGLFKPKTLNLSGGKDNSGRHTQERLAAEWQKVEAARGLGLEGLGSREGSCVGIRIERRLQNW